MTYSETVNSILKTSYFVESPMYYDGTFNSQMQDIEHNKKITKKITENNKQFDNFINWNVYKVQDSFDENVFTFCLVKDSITDAFVEIASRGENNFSRGVWQREGNRSLIRDFILNFFPKYYKSLISDKTANKMGIVFYKKLLEGALKMGFEVKVLMGSLKNEIDYIPKNFESYWTSVDNDIPTHPTFVTSKDVLFKIKFKYEKNN